ncbi:MAG TPA: sigma-54-dependent Fis family transcriptional regulator [Gemmatimonadetes bacterium]|nr:sigma-54-dependent Fis family transcriptional regulator [Gemmatimonadota bacterium]
MSRILLVDDDADLRSVFREKLEHSGHEVDEAGSAEAALAKVGAFDPALMVTDVRMEGMTGLELLERVRESMESVDVIVMTGHDTMTSAVEAMKAGAFDYLVKPVGLKQLMAVVDRCLGDRELNRAAEEQQEAEGREAGDIGFDDAESDTGPRRVIGRDPRMVEIYKMIGVLSRNRATVLVRGDTGTGKELIARAVHDHSIHSDEPFIAVNCTALTDTLLESELFGHVRGAFTGAVGGKKGYFELAGRGTIFLDEIGDTSPDFQSKLLRVLQERQFYPVGGEQPKTTEARVVAATHQPMEELVTEGGFREDLYFRLRVVEIHVPSLRERREDIPQLAQHLLGRIRRETGATVRSISPEAMTHMKEYDWPGNVRELENALTRASIVARGPLVGPDHLTLGMPAVGASTPNRSSRVPEGDLTLDGAIECQIRNVMEKSGGNKTEAASLLGISRSRLTRYVERFGL